MKVPFYLCFILIGVSIKLCQAGEGDDYDKRCKYFSFLSACKVRNISIPQVHQSWNCLLTKKYPLRRYILGMLTHTTALDWLWGGDETLTMCFKIEYTHLGFATERAVWFGIWNSEHVVLKFNIRTLASSRREQSDLASGTLTMWF